MPLIWLVLIIASPPVLAFDYFGNQIDYWNKDSPPPSPSPPKKPRPKKESKKFDWQEVLDPKSDAFFEEGNYKPPKAFMELARNPSDENIKNWLAMIDTKNRLMQRLHTQMAAYLEKNGKSLKPKERAALEEKTKAIPQVATDASRFRFRLYFDSSCPHCKHMMKTAKELQNMGYYLEVRQIDRQKPSFPVPFSIAYASKEEIRSKKINAWPVLFVGDVSKQLVYRIQGYHDTQSILGVLATK